MDKPNQPYFFDKCVLSLKKYDNVIGQIGILKLCINRFQNGVSNSLL